LVDAFMGNGLGLEQLGPLGIKIVTVRALKEIDSVRKKVVVRSNLGLKLDFLLEVVLGRVNDRDQRELGFVDRNSVALKGGDETAINLFQQAPAILGEGQAGLIEDEVMIGA